MSTEQIDNLKNKKKDIIESFNQIALNMVLHLAKEFKDSSFGKNVTMIKNFFRFKPNEIIILYLENIYANDDYRKQIKAGNEQFFMQQTYDEVKNTNNESHIFEFKDIWCKMNNGTKSIVKDSMGMLVDHCELYLNVVSEINSLKNK